MKTYKLFSALVIFAAMQSGTSQIQGDLSPALAVSKAPDKKFEITDCFNPKYYPESPKMFQWISGTEYYTLLEDNSLMLANSAKRYHTCSMRLISNQVWFCVSHTSVVKVPRTARAFSRAARKQDTMEDGLLSSFTMKSITSRAFTSPCSLV